MLGDIIEASHVGKRLFISFTIAFLILILGCGSSKNDDKGCCEPPTISLIVGSYDTPGNARGIFVNGNYAYLTDWDNGLYIINIADPASPTLTGSYDTPGRAESVFIHENYAYIADGNSGLLILDVSNPNSPSLVGSYTSLPWATKVFVSKDTVTLENYAFVIDGAYRIYVIKVQTPSLPSLISEYDGVGGVAPPGCFQFGDIEGLFVKGDWAYIVESLGRLITIDMSDEVNPSIGDCYDLTPIGGMDVFVNGNYAFVASGNSLKIIDVSIPTTIQGKLAGSYDNLSWAWGVFVNGNNAFIADYNTGLKIIDISNVNSPSLKGSISIPGNASKVFVQGNYAYVASDNAGLKIIDISGF